MALDHSLLGISGAGVARRDATADEVMALVAGAFAAIRHAGAETSRKRSAHIAQIILDGLRPQAPVSNARAQGPNAPASY